MNDRPLFVRRGVFVVALLSAACDSDGGPRKITKSREVVVRPGSDHINASSAERFPDLFGGGGPHGGAHDATSATDSRGGSAPGINDLSWTTPAGWTQIPTKQFHLLDLRAGANPEVECSLSIVGGSLLDNVNRWRGQFGQPPLDAAALKALPTQLLLGIPAVRVEIEGSFAGMGGTTKDGYKLVGLVAGADARQVFVKLTGPKAAVEQELAAFDRFTASLRPKDLDSGNPHGAGPAAQGGSPQEDFGFILPDGWSTAPLTPNRLVNLRSAKHPEVECYVSVAGGKVLPNVNRWRKQFGLPEIDSAALEALPKQALLGMPATLVELDGAFTAMGGTPKEGFKLLGLVADAGEEQLFVKLTGPKNDVDAERTAFNGFAASLQMKEPAGHSSAAHPAPNAAPSTSTPPPADPAAAPAAPAAANGAFDPTQLKYDAPAGWTQQPQRPMRLATFTVGTSKNTECALSAFPGDLMGIAANVQRWRDQMGLAKATEQEVASLAKLKVLGVDATVVDLLGKFNDSMSKRSIDNARFLGLICTVTVQGETWTLFVKLTGPEPEVAAAKDAFTSFCQSLRL